MKLIIGTGACGFQRIHHILNRLGYSSQYKIMPRKMQNSFEIDYNNFINEKLSVPQILIGSFYLNILESIIEKYPNIKILCLKGDREKTIKSLMTHFGFRNPLIKNRESYSRYNLNFFENYHGMENVDSIRKFYEYYYEKVSEISEKYPNKIITVNSKDYFENENVQSAANNFFGINGIIVEDLYKIKNEEVITTSLHGGLGNNLFQMIEALVFAEVNNLPEPEFKTWNCSLLPPCNNSDIILGGHGGSWEDFNNAFKNVKFTHPEIADFDKKFVINDMFDFQILHKYRDIILDKFEPSEEIVNYINEKYKHLLEDSCSLHIRTCNSKGDTHKINISNDYYEKALNQIFNKNILVFTDSIEHCKPILKPLTNKYSDKVFHIIDENQFVSLFMISMCVNNVVNISTFSFWGAYLNKRQPNNKTIVPNNFGHEPNMLCYNEWIKI